MQSQINPTEQTTHLWLKPPSIEHNVVKRSMVGYQIQLKMKAGHQI